MTEPAARKTVKYVLEASAAFLAGKDVGQNARHVSELLMARLLNCPRLELYLRYDAVLEERLLAAMRRGVKRVAVGEPIQYVLGRAAFMGHAFKVDRRVLIPRPETEELVELVLDYEPLWRKERPAVVDLGTGSGCIAISLAKAKPDARCLALDTSPDAIALAKENAEALGVVGEVTFAPAQLSDVIEPETVDAIVANLPYVPTPEYEALPTHIRDHEPRSALDGGPDGTSIIAECVQDAAIALAPGGALFLEIAESQADAVSAMMQDAGFKDVALKQDLAGRDRIVWGTLPE
jgi:release factor glutamine methyltransferase